MKHCPTVLFVVPLLLFSAAIGCVPMGLPEHFSAAVAENELIDPQTRPHLARHLPARKRVLLALGKDFELGTKITEADRSSLGSQYMFGLFPFTRLYLEHGEQSLLLELLIDVLGEEGFSVGICRAQDAQTLAELTDTQLVIYPNIDELSVNAYDVLFIRILRIYGVLTLSYENKNLASVVGPRVDRREIKQRIYRSYGLAPRLARLLERTLKEELRASVRAYEQQHQRRKQPIVALSGNSPQVVVVALPEFSNTPAADLGAVLAKSYGFRNVEAYENGVIARLLQRGMVSALEDVGVITLSVISKDFITRPANVLRKSSVWHVATTIEEVVIEEGSWFGPDSGVSLKLSFDLREQQADGRASSLLQAICRVSTELDFDVDGPWVRALERAAYDLTDELFNRSGDSGGACGAKMLVGGV